jgi:uncharacterized protein YabE (DUF348 family)
MPITKIKKVVTEQTEAVAETSQEQIKRRPYIIPLLGLLLGFIFVAAILIGHRGLVQPGDAHVVFLTDKGHRTVLDTKAKTVGELVDRLNLNLITEDVVEPARDTPIPEDNFRINIYRARPVTVIDNSNKTVTLTAQKSARVVAQISGLQLHPEDAANFEQGNVKENVIGEKVVVSRATPVKLNLYGSPVPTYTQAKTVGDLLKEKQITLLDGESVQPNAKTAVTADMEVFVLRKDAKLVNVEEAIPVPEQVVQDPSLSFGTTAERQAGTAGKKTVTYLIQADGSGREISRTPIHETVTVAAVPKITARGSTIDISGDKSGVMAAAGIAAGDYGYANYIISRESNWHVTAQNASGAYGLCQALPGSKMASAGGDWQTNPVTQLKWCNGYAQAKGGWAASYNYWVSHHYW